MSDAVKPHAEKDIDGHSSSALLFAPDIGIVKLKHVSEHILNITILHVLAYLSAPAPCRKVRDTQGHLGYRAENPLV